MSRPASSRQTQADRRLNQALAAIAALVGGFLVVALVVTFVTRSGEPSSFDPSLPNPMGGPARTAPGDATGSLSLGPLRIDGAEVAMGDVGLGITYVPDWEVVNTSTEDVRLVVGQPQVIAGCCPGPVYADGELTSAGQQLTVPASGRLTLQFPLQMHPGMDGPHHLIVPLGAGDETNAVHVTGNFTADA